MTEVQRTEFDGLLLPTGELLPHVQQFGEQQIEFTFLGNNAEGFPTWIVWSAQDPFLIGILSRRKVGYDLEQRTSAGPLLQQSVTLGRVQRALRG